MSTYKILFVREQRVYFEVEAETEDEAEALASEMSNGFNLDSPDDQSDDPGEIMSIEPVGQYPGPEKVVVAYTHEIDHPDGATQYICEDAEGKAVFGLYMGAPQYFDWANPVKDTP